MEMQEKRIISTFDTLQTRKAFSHLAESTVKGMEEKIVGLYSD